MTDTACLALAVLTTPACILLSDLLEEDVARPCSLADLEARVAGRLECDTGEVLRCLDLMVGGGFALRCAQDPGGWVGVGRTAFADRLEHVMTALRDLRLAGDTQQVADWKLAMDAAWDARSASPVIRRKAEQFAASPAGRRHAARLAAGSLGLPDAGPGFDPVPRAVSDPVSDSGVADM